MSFWEHLDELRKTLIQVFVTITAGALCCLIFYDVLFAFLTAPLQTSPSSLIQHKIQKTRIFNPGPETILFSLPKEAAIFESLPTDIQKISENEFAIGPKATLEIEEPTLSKPLILLSPIEGTLLSLKISFWGGLVLTCPLWLWQVSRFVAPAIGDNVKKVLIPFILFSLLSIFLGFVFSYYLTIPIANTALFAFNSDLGNNYWSLTEYINYTLVLILAHGAAFELFIILLFLIHFGILKAETLIRKRRFAIVMAFILGALFTPPDVFTQILLAIPLMAFYELAILYARFRKRTLEKRYSIPVEIALQD